MAEVQPLATRLILAHPRKPFIALISLLLAFLLGVFDALIQPDISSTLLYLFPIIMAAWYTDFWVGVGVTVFGVLSAVAGDLLTEAQYRNLFIPLWNFSSRLVIHLLIVYVFTVLRKHIEITDTTARTDALTRLGNRRQFYDAANAELRRLKTQGGLITLIYFDLDNFKMVNDRYGHQTGDLVLKTIGEVLRASLRRTDVVARLGGDEFVILLPNTPPTMANEVVARLRHNLDGTMQAHQWPVTFSIGMATFSERPRSVDEMLNAVDHLMYMVKSQGKNGVSQRVFGKTALPDDPEQASDQQAREIL